MGASGLRWAAGTSTSAEVEVGVGAAWGSPSRPLRIPSSSHAARSAPTSARCRGFRFSFCRSGASTQGKPEMLEAKSSGERGRRPKTRKGRTRVAQRNAKDPRGKARLAQARGRAPGPGRRFPTGRKAPASRAPSPGSWSTPL